LALEEVPAEFRDQYAAGYIWITQHLTSLPEWLANLTDLTRLNVSNNELTSLPDWLGNLTALTELKLSSNRLTALPASLGNLAALTKLHLDWNRLTALPASLGNLAALTELDLSNNRLTALPASLGNLAALTELDLSSNQLTALPKSLGNLTALFWLKLLRNQLTSLPEWLGDLTSVRRLELHGNQLTSLPEWLGDLTSLRRLDLSSNQLTSLPDSLGNLTALTELDLNWNQLTSLPDSLGNLTALTELNLAGNELTTLPDSLGYLTALAKGRLGLADNPLVSPPANVVRAGKEAVLGFLRARQAEWLRQWSAKLIVVGQARVGKTSLVRALSGQQHDPGELTTHGLRVGQLDLAHPREPGVRMTLCVWDFGGQDIYHATHQFFITDESVFVLAWSANSSTDRDRLGYWLSIITARAPQAPILIVATHADDRAADIDIRSWQRQYQGIIGHFEVDCASGTGIGAVRTAITKAAAALKVMGEQWPRTWLRATNSLCRAGGPPHITAADMWNIMTAADVTDPAEQQGLARSLHLRGRIVYHADVADLADIVMRDPQWLSTRISQLLDTRAVRDRRGILTTADVMTAWRDLEQAERDVLLAMLDTFDVCYRVADSRDDVIGVVVSWLPQSPPDYADAWLAAALPGGGEIRLSYQLPVMPPGIPSWFLVRSRRFATSLTWRSGALLRHPDGAHTALLCTDTARQEIELTVRGPLPAGFMAVLDDGLTLTFDRYPGLPVRRLVSCNVHGPCATRFVYADLITRLTNGRRTVYCDELDDMIDIVKLLNGIPARDSELLGVLRGVVHSELDLVRSELGRIGDSQRQMMKDIAKVRTAQKQHCPSVFTLTRTGKRRPGQRLLTLRLYCEEPDSWHPLPGDAGCYEIAEQSEWLRKVGPWLARTLDLLKMAAPLAAPIMGIAAHELRDRISDDLDLTQALLDEIRAPGTGAEAVGPQAHRPASRAVTDADFRILRQELLKLDKTTRWGGLNYHITPEAVGLYLCADHLAAYQQLPAAPST
jgi:internalin A